MQFRHRYYSTELGRFLTRDPLALMQTLTFSMHTPSGRTMMRMYLFAGAAPLSHADPTGLRHTDAGGNTMPGYRELWQLCYTHCQSDGGGAAEWCYESCCTAFNWSVPECRPCGESKGAGTKPIDERFYIDWYPLPSYPHGPPVSIRLSRWRGAFIWSCVSGYADVDPAPGWTGLLGGGRNIGGITIIAGLEAVPGNKSRWERCPNGCSRFVVELAVYFKKRIGLIVDTKWVFHEVHFHLECPCQPAEST